VLNLVRFGQFEAVSFCSSEVDALARLIENDAAYSSSSPSVLPVDRLTRCTRVQTGQLTLS
jgi:hypothetical protein